MRGSGAQRPAKRLAWQAAIAALLGKEAAAVRLLEQAMRAGLLMSSNGPHGRIDLLPLHGYAPFDALVKPKG